MIRFFKKQRLAARGLSCGKKRLVATPELCRFPELEEGLLIRGGIVLIAGALLAFFCTAGDLSYPFKHLLYALLILALAATAGTILTRLFGDPAQWIVLGTGVYAVASWAQTMAHDDPEGFALIWRNRALMGVNIGYGLTCALAYAASAFGPLYAMQTFHAPPAQVALIVGGVGGAGGADTAGEAEHVAGFAVLVRDMRGECGGDDAACAGDGAV